MNAILANTVGRSVEQLGDVRGGRLSCEDFGKEGGVVAARGFEKKFARRSALMSF